MKNLLIILFLPLLVLSCKNSENSSKETSESPEMERSSWAKDHLNGKVKSIEETPFTLDENGNISEMDSCCIEIKEFNDKGYFMKNTYKNNEGTITRVNVIKRLENGKSLSNTRIENGKEVWKRVVKRDEEGNPLDVIDTDSTQQVTSVHRGDNYNEFKQALSGKSYTIDGSYLGTWSFKYIDGMRTGNGWIDSTNVQRIDRTGEVNDKGWLSRVVDIRVDENGDSTTTIETYTYDSFDEQGNWTQCTEMDGDKPVKVMKRTYVYY